MGQGSRKGSMGEVHRICGCYLDLVVGSDLVWSDPVPLFAVLSVPQSRYDDGMDQVAKTFRLRSTSGEDAKNWLTNPIGLSKKNGAPVGDPLPWDDVERHPENYVVIPNFTTDEGTAWQVLTLQEALRYQRILEVAGFETRLA